jgi:Flp pilus assembly protein TadG
MRFLRDQNGAVLVETTVMMALMFVFVLGSIDFLFLLYQWNAATKAVQLGARIAAVSNPVATGLNNLSNAVVSVSVSPGAAMPFFEVRCNGATATCICTGTCTGVNGYDTAAMNTIIFGRGSSSCTDATSAYNAGMCDIFGRIKAANVVISYTQTGLGYAGRPGGPAPTITLALQNMSFQFFFLSGLLRFNDIRMPALTTSVTAEDLSSSAPSM